MLEVSVVQELVLVPVLVPVLVLGEAVVNDAGAGGAGTSPAAGLGVAAASPPVGPGFELSPPPLYPPILDEQFPEPDTAHDTDKKCTCHAQRNHKRTQKRDTQREREAKR